MAFFVYKVSGEVMVNFCQDLDLCRKVQSTQIFPDAVIRPISDSLNFLCVGSSSSLLPVKPLMAVSGKSRLLCAGFRTEAHRRCRVAEGGLHL
jgi:hypothetical protein